MLPGSAYSEATFGPSGGGETSPAAAPPGAAASTDFEFDQNWQVIRVAQGGYAVSGDPDACLVTMLGSCVATCLWDPELRLAGMNHYLLPGNGEDRGRELRYGVNAMELLINGMLKRGARKSRLVSKLFGGAQMIGTKSDIGSRNVSFAQRYLSDEGIGIVGGSLGGLKGRRLRFYPRDGRVQQRYISAETVPPIVEAEAAPQIAPATGGEIELFQ